MPVPAEDRFVAYAPVMATDTFPVPFTVYGDPTDSSLLEVKHDGEIVNPDDYTFSGTTDHTVSPAQTINGNVVFPVGITGTVTIEGNREPERISQFVEGVGIPARSHNAVLDAIVATEHEIWQRQVAIREDLTTETEERIAADLVLTEGLATETAARISGDNALDERMDTLEQAAIDGLDFLTNTESEARAGVENTKASTALRVAQAIETLGIYQVATRAALQALTLRNAEMRFMGGALAAGDGGSGIFRGNTANLTSTLIRITRTSTSVDATADTIGISTASIETGMQCLISAAVNGLNTTTAYWIKRVDSTTIQLASNFTNFAAGTYVDLTAEDPVTIRVLFDPQQGVYVIPTGLLLDGSQGAWVRQGAGLGDANVAWFRLDWLGFQGAVNLKGFVGGGRVIAPSGTHSLSLPLIMAQNDVTLEGQGSGQAVGALSTTSATTLRGTHQYGPVIRRKVDHCHLRAMTIASDATRFAATRVTKDNYAGLMLTRDDQNYGIWTEADDHDDELYVTDCHDEDVWVEEQPNDGVVWMGGYYRSSMKNGGIRDCVGHGKVEGDGTYTGRDPAAILVGGILKTADFAIFNCTGHATVSGHPDASSGSVIRSLTENLDTYNCGTDAAIMHAPGYICYSNGDECKIIDGAISCGAGKQAIVGAGRVQHYLNNRYLNVDADAAPVKITGTHLARNSGGFRVMDGLLQTLAGTGAGGLGVCPYFVELDGAGDGGHIVHKGTLDGTFSTSLVGPLHAFREVRGAVGRSFGEEHFDGGVFFGSTATVVIASGTVALPSTGAVVLVVDTEAAAASDNLDTVTGGTVGRWLHIRPADNNRDIVLVHSTAGSGFRLAGGTNITLANVLQGVWFRHNGSSWTQQTAYLNIA